MGRYKPKVPVQSHTDPWVERRLDEELEQTFPASDALQITVDPPPAPKVQPGGQKPRAKRFARA